MIEKNKQILQIYTKTHTYIVQTDIIDHFVKSYQGSVYYLYFGKVL